ncbi:wobble nucleotide-excising tRNase [Pseudomonas chlororaphis]|uniref:AAA family ATPase n=1 Tax=Pseudomonas chlororaphis TaxID=587753 RepID=UPI0020A1412D|nr:AAA family ATPase [Pseudomonas chlororaphis]MCP1479551.1 wobble nucleotide-excising tRNase [Pseudomonas chlororaphis]MCP1594097.1 wobble nucleotide-excising tRNase [Pseudomonas chlororaphis]
MISKIQIQGVASYQTPVILDTDKKVNIIYGLNGTGKSTLSNYLYNRSEVGYEKCSITINEDEEILVYNQKFIHDNFFEADNLKGIFSLSKENKETKEKIEAVEIELEKMIKKSELEQKNIEAEEKKITKTKDQACEKVWEIKKKYSGGDRVLEYCLENLKGKKETLFDYISSLEKPLSQPQKDIPQIKKEVEAISGETAKKSTLLQKITIEDPTTESNTILEEIIVGSDDSPVSGLIKKLNNSDWVRKGIAFITRPEPDQPSECPFCQERTITEALANQISNYFNETYDNSIGSISNLLERYKIIASNLSPLDIYKTHPFAESFLPELTEKYLALEKTLTENLATIKAKLNTPSVPLSLSATKYLVQDLNNIIEKINNCASKHNHRIDNIETEMTALKRDFWNFLRWEYDQTISPCISDSKASIEVIKEHQFKKAEALKEATKKRNEITELQRLTINIEESITKINDSLTQLGITDFSIEKHNDTLYRIVRNKNSQAIFSSLSEGEKMIISFLYFCELCKGKRNASEVTKKKIAIIDDPVSSLSHIYVYNIGQLLKTEFFSSASFEQVFVLTHSLYFFYELADSNHARRGENQKLFRLTKNNNGTSIKTMKYEEVQNDYHSYWTVINDKNQSPALIANCMRNIIEYFFNFVQKADLSNVVQKPELQENKFQAFCRYINRESHSLGQNIFDFKEFNYEDFREGLKLVFQVTGYPEHYEKMTKSLVP